MLYIGCREADGYQQVSNECAPATAVHGRTGRGRNQTCDSQRPPRTWTGTETGGVGQTVWIEPGAGSRSAPATRSGGTGRVVPSQGNCSCLPVARGHSGGLLHKDHAGNKGPSTGSSKNDRIRLFKGRNRAGSDRRRSKSSTLSRAKLGVSRNPISAGWDAAAIEYHQDPSSSRTALSPGRFCCSRFQEGITRRPSQDPCCLSQAGHRRGGSGIADASVRIRKEHRFLCSPSDGRIWACRFFPITPNPDVRAEHLETHWPLLLRSSALLTSITDSVVTFLTDERLTPGKTRSLGLLESRQFLHLTGFRSVEFADWDRVALWQFAPWYAVHVQFLSDVPERAGIA